LSTTSISQGVGSRQGAEAPRSPEGGLPAGVLSPSDRDRILQAMTECCAEHGYRQTSVAEVIARAGVSREEFEGHFSSKEECAVAALNLLTSEVVAALAMSPAPGSSELADAARGVKAILELMATEPAKARLGYIQARQGGSEKMREAYSSAALVVTPMVEQARRFAEVEACQPAGAARAALGGAEALVRRELSEGRAERLPELVPDFIYALLVPFVGQAEALRQVQLAIGLNDEDPEGKKGNQTEGR